MALAALGSAPWRIHSGGAPVLAADTAPDVGYNTSYSIPDFPVEQGAFSRYHSVEQPFEAWVRFASGGSPDARAALAASVECILGHLNLYDVVTSDRTYVNANLTREEHRCPQADGGGALLSIEVGVREVRVLAGSTTGQNAADLASAHRFNGGTVQPVTPTAGQSAAALPIFASGTVPPTLGGTGMRRGGRHQSHELHRISGSQPRRDPSAT